MEISLSSRYFTWSNSQGDHIFVVLDRVLTSVSWDAHFPLSSLVALPKVGSDHTPLVLDTGARKNFSPKLFRFEKWWLSQPGFSELVPGVWNTESNATSGIENWQFKVRLLRKTIKGWSINIEVGINRNKKALLMVFFREKKIFKQ